MSCGFAPESKSIYSDQSMRVVNIQISAIGFWFLALVFALQGLSAHSAPIPATSSSMVLGTHGTLFRSALGFEIHANKTDWRPAPLPTSSDSIVALYVAPTAQKGVQASLSVRVDRLERPTRLAGYVKRWMKDYGRLGFDVLASKPIQVKGQQAYMIDVTSRESDKQLRQMIFIKNRTAVVMTCRDQKDRFMKTVDACNDIMTEFRWL